MTPRELEVQRIKKDWAENPRWNGVKRGYSAEDVYRLRGSLQVEHTLAPQRRREALAVDARAPLRELARAR
jgi:isocitrate lyase